MSSNGKTNLLKCVIVDDEHLQHKVLEDYISKIPYLHLLASFVSPVEALIYLNINEVELIFLDIEMSQLTGLQFLQVLPQSPSIIITSAYPKYAIDTYEYEVKDYLLKPISFERFCKAVAKVRGGAIQASSLEESSTIPSKFLFVKTSTKYVRLDLKDILYIEGLKDYIALITIKGKVLTLQSMNAVESSLAQGGFVRVHKSFIVALDKITIVDKEYIYIQEHAIPIGASYRQGFLAKIERFKM
jgi:DNA-binding LytR/AlgR family response regulator